ncbi:hypothetical protein LPJ53_000092 [Coemansia erecta]|uniref:BHLH domain-containing protein n=1 Tax=Coemansia erecta TaxID=147472 RepID=A0A9W8CVK9_9FUNG|nr:hypothetical protein LPJ53_000092 [Coemansia erecta]
MKHQVPAPIPTLNTLFDSNEESYLNSFLDSFDPEGLDLGPYLASPAPMANFSARTDFSSMGMGMGIGAGIMSAMDDSIPHLSLEEGAQEIAGPMHRLSHISPNPASLSAHNQSQTGAGGMMPMRRPSFFDYGLGGTSHLSLGNVMTEEMHKVSSWLFHNQDHHATSPRSWSNAVSQTIAGASSHHVPSQSQLTSAAGALGFPDHQRQPSESEFSVKRKASQEQLEQPRKSRGSVWSPIRETPTQMDQNTMAAVAAAPAEVNASSVEAADDKGKSKAADATSKRRDEKKALSQRIVLTEDERRANHIASEQRRRNQIRQGYAELMSLVTTLRDPALGNASKERRGTCFSRSARSNNSTN